MKRRKQYQLLSLVIIFCLVFSQIPTIAFAAVDTETHQQPSESNAVLAESTETVTAFNLGNGYMHKTYHSEAVRYKDDDGKLTDYNPALVSVKDDKSKNGKSLSYYRWVNKQGDSQQYFPENFNYPILLEKDGYGIEMSLLSEATFEAPQLQTERRETPYHEEKESNLTVSYASADGAQRIEYTSENSGVKESIVLSEIPKDNVFSYVLKSDGLTAELKENRVLLKDHETKKIKAVIDAPFMYDASEGGACSEAIVYTLEKDKTKKNTYLLTLSVSEAYLRDKHRVYPVTVDPSIFWTAETDFYAVYIDEMTPNSNEEADIFYYAADDMKTYIDLPDIESGVSVTDAILTLYEGANSEICDVEVKRITSAWDTASVSWNNQPSVYDQPVDSFYTDAGDGVPYDIDLTELYQSYANGSVANHGIVLEGEDGYCRFYSYACRDNALMPYISLTYTTGIPSIPSSLTVRKQSDNGYTSNAYFKPGEDVYVSWSGISCTALGKVQYKVTAADSSTPSPTSVGSQGLNLTNYRDFAVADGSATGANVSVTGLQYLPEGKYTIHVRGVNTAGQAGDAKTVTFYVDGTAPVLTNVSIDSGVSADEPSEDKRPTISWNATDTYFSSVKVAVNDGTVVKATSSSGSRSYRIPSGKMTTSGVYLLTVTAEDKAGNTTDAEISYYLDVDNPMIQNLTLTPQTTAGNPTDNINPQVGWNISDTFFDRMQYKVGSGDYQTMSTQANGSFTLPETIWSSGSGTYSLTFRALDKAGHSATVEKTYHLTTDQNHEPRNVTVREYYGKAFLAWELDTYIPSKKQYDLHRGTGAAFTPSANTLIAEDVDMEKLYMADTQVLNAGNYYYCFVIQDKAGVTEDIITSPVSYTVADVSSALSTRNGFKDYLSYFEFGMPQGTGYIEKSSGNLVYEQTDYTVSNAQIDYSLTRIYNSKNTLTGMFGKGWTDSYHKELYTDENQVYFVDTDGSVLVYELVGNTYTCEESKEYILVKENGTFKLTDKGQIVYTFNESGQLASVTEPNGCSLTYSYDLKGRLASVTAEGNAEDSARTLHFVYSGEENMLESVIDFNDHIYSYTYSSGKLTQCKITDGSNSENYVAYDYGYAVSGLLNSIKDGKGNAYTASYTSGKAEKVTYPNQENYTIDYRNAQTTITKKNEQGSTVYTESFTFDETTGKVLSVTDVVGRTTEYSYQNAADGLNPYLLASETSDFYYQSLDADTVKLNEHLLQTISYTYDANDNPDITKTSYSIPDGAGSAAIELPKDEITNSDYNNDNQLTKETTTLAASGEETGVIIDNTTYTYTEDGNLESVSDSVNKTTEVYGYDSDGNETESRSYNRVLTENQVNSELTSINENIDSSVDSISKTVSVYDVQGNAVSEIMKTADSEIKIANSYDAMGEMTRSTEDREGTNVDPTGIISALSEDDNIMPNKVVDEISKEITTVYSYDFLGRETSCTVTTLFWDEEAALAGSENPWKERTTQTVKTYNGNSNLETENTFYITEDPLTDVQVTVTKTTTYEYDNLNRCIRTTISGTGFEPGVTVTEYGYASDVSVEDGLNGRTESIAYMETVKTGSSANNLEAVSVKYMDKEGNVIKEVTGESFVCYTYDNDGTQVVSYTGSSAEIEHLITLSLQDQHGNVFTEIINPGINAEAYTVTSDSVKTTSTYDLKGNVLTETDALGISTAYGYDKENRIEFMKINGIVANSNSRDIAVTYSETDDGTLTTTITDARGNLKVETTDGSGQTRQIQDIGNSIEEKIASSYSYDSLGNNIGILYGDGSGILNEYDINGCVYRSVSFDADGNKEKTVEYEYDLNGNITLAKLVEDDGITEIYKEAFYYDAAGCLVKKDVIYGSNDAAENRKTICYGYDYQGRLTEVTYPAESGLGTVSYSYDDYGNLLNIKQNNQLISEYFYDGFYRISKRKDYTVPGGSSFIQRDYGYDVFGRVTSMVYTENGNEAQILESYAYVYDKNGNIVSETHVSNLDGAEINETREYTYDAYGRLTKSETTDHRNSDAVSVVTYGYDSVGNRTSMTEDGVTTSYIYNGLNQLTEKTKAGETNTYLYDARGNQIQERSGNTVTNFTYGVTGEMLSVSNGTTVIQENQYNHEGIRISRTEGSTERKYLYDNGSVAYTLDNNAVSAANVLGGYQNTIGTYRGSNYYVYNKDIQGSTESITNSSFIAKAAYEYSDFGEVTELIEAIDNEICYTGSIHDETTGLHYMNARYYDPENGRFISQDSYRGELDDVGQWHLYAYCANNPINYVDPSGHWRTVSRSPVSWAIDVAVAVFCPGAWWAYDVLGETLEYAFKKKGIKKVSSILINDVVPKVKGVYGTYYTKIRTAIYRSTGYTIKFGSPSIVNEAIKNLANLLNRNKNKILTDAIVDCFSLGGAISVVLDRFTDGTINNKIKIY